MYLYCRVLLSASFLIFYSDKIQLTLTILTTSPAALLAGSCPTIPSATGMASSVLDSPRPTMCECRPTLSTFSTSFTSPTSIVAISLKFSITFEKGIRKKTKGKCKFSFETLRKWTFREQVVVVHSFLHPSAPSGFDFHFRSNFSSLFLAIISF